MVSLTTLKYTHATQDFEDWVASTYETDGRSQEELRNMYGIQNIELFKDYFARTCKRYSKETLPNDLVLSEFRSKILGHGGKLKQALDDEFEHYELFEQFEKNNVDNVGELLFHQFLQTQKPEIVEEAPKEPEDFYSDLFKIVNILNKIQTLM